MSRDSFALAVVLAAAAQLGCSSSSQGTSGDAGRNPADAAQGSSDGAHEESTGSDASPEASSSSDGSGESEGDGGEGDGGCQLSANSVLINPTFVVTSGSPAADCPSAANKNILGSGCTLDPTGPCTANAACTILLNNADGTSGSYVETGTVTVSGAAATGSLVYSDCTGFTCSNTISGPVTLSMGTPGACEVTCDNGSPNNEDGCDPCIMKACASAYAACEADKSTGGCISCSDLLGGNAGSGFNCTATEQLLTNLLDCACMPATCD